MMTKQDFNRLRKLMTKLQVATEPQVDDARQDIEDFVNEMIDSVREECEE
jgi:hypothetical protein